MRKLLIRLMIYSSISAGLLCSCYAEDYKIGNTTIRIISADITTLTEVDAIVNAANTQLKPGSGVCGAIYKAAGLAALDALVQTALGDKTSIPVGEALLSGVPKGSLLDKNGIKYIIHAVGPDCRDDIQLKDWRNLLSNAYTNTLQVAKKQKIRTIAFPFISSVIFACPKPDVGTIAINAVIDYIRQDQTQFDLVLFTILGPDAMKIFTDQLDIQTKKTGTSDSIDLVRALNDLTVSLRKIPL
jgi:O-acetyl-ADP-ribose deacetylase